MNRSWSFLNGASVLLSVAPWCLLPATVGTEPSSDEILAKVADSSIKRYAVAYSGLRKYRLRNLRFEKEATLSVQVAYRPGDGKTFTVLERLGSPKLSAIVEKLLAYEADASRGSKLADHEISPDNYEACLRGTEITGGRNCYVIDLLPKHKSKYLIKGTAWVDRNSYGVLRLEGSTSASVSMWIGAPRVQQEFSEIGGLWLPVHTAAVSSGLLLGTSELEIRYGDYLITNPDRPAPSRAADSIPPSKP